MSQWLKTLTGCLCMLTVLMHLVPRGKFSKYVRFYAGLLFFLVAARPVWNLFSGEGELERLLQLSFLKDSYYDLESSVAGMSELKNDRIMEAYRGEIERQLGEIALAYGLAASDIRVTYGTEDSYQITGISFAARVSAVDMRPQGNTSADIIEAVKREIAEVYVLDPGLIQIRREEAGQWESGWTK